MEYCLSCFGRSRTKSGEREPLLPKDFPRQHSSRDLSQASSTVVDAERPVVDKIVDVLAALNAGKLPTQDQISNFLRVLLQSELLRDVPEKGKVVAGYGPLSKQGRKVLVDVRVLVQAALQFGLEKNADNKLQELYFQVVQIGVPPVEITLNKPTALKASQTALTRTKEGADELAQEGPSANEAVFDAQTFIFALRTLVETCLSSSVFRLILADLISIAREQFADTAADVEHATHEVELTAAELEQAARAGQVNDIIVAGAAAAEGQPELDTSKSVSFSVDDVKEKGSQVADKIKTAAESATREWEGVGEDVKAKAKQRTLQRLQQLVARIQKDASSRSALRAILILIRKYSEKVTSASEVISSTIEKAVTETQDVLVEDVNAGPSKKPFIDITSDALLEDSKTILERLAQGRSLDGVLLALSRVVQDLEDLPPIIEEQVNEKIEEKLSESAPEPIAEPEPSPALPSPSPTPPEPQLSKSQKKKRKKKQRALERAREAASPPVTPTSAQPEVNSPEESPEESPVLEKVPVLPEPTVVVETTISVSSGNPIRAYFTRVGEYLDKSLEPEWALSDEGARTLESLIDDGVELTDVVSVSVADIGKEISEGPTTVIGGETKDITQRYKERDEEIRRKFKVDLTTFFDELEAFITAVENDKTTMALVRAFDTLGVDLTELVKQEAEKKIGAATSWASWLGWAIPRILNLIPSDALPIPSLEAKTRKMGVALRPLFLRGLGRTSKLTTSLIPDEIVIKEWSEMRIDMADHEHGSETHNSVSSPDVHTTSRVRMHMDGIRAKVEGTGYYFKYKGGLLRYEDEGVLSVDVGMEGVHEGLELDFEIEVQNGQVETESRQQEIVTPPKLAVPDIIVEDADTGLISNSGAEGETNAEILTLGTNGDAVRESAPADPLFHVTDVSVSTHGLHFKIDQSKHWIINKLLVQPLAGPVVGRLVKKALEEKVKALLDSLAQGLGEVSRAAKRRGEERRKRAAKRAVQERVGRVGGGGEARLTNAEVEAEMVLVREEESVTQLLSDWWGALLYTGPSVLGRTTTAIVGGDDEEPVQTRTSLQATSQGVIYTSTSIPSSRRSPSRSSSPSGPVREQPQETPEMVYHPETKSFEEVDQSEVNIANDDSRDVDEVVVAVGGAQLFPGKAGAPPEDRGVLEGVKENVQGALERAGEGVKEHVDTVQRAEERWGERTREERLLAATRNGHGPPRSKVPGAWESDAFDW